MSFSDFELSVPTLEEGRAVHALIAECPPLDTNSLYCNLLQTHHFAATSIAAKRQNKLEGFVSGYRIPGQPDTLFVWQVAVAESARGEGLGSRMLDALVDRPGTAFSFLETTITADNRASWALFERFAQARGANLTRSPLFEREAHFGGNHSTEILVRIGPF